MKPCENFENIQKFGISSGTKKKFFCYSPRFILEGKIVTRESLKFKYRNALITTPWG